MEARFTGVGPSANNFGKIVKMFMAQNGENRMSTTHSYQLNMLYLSYIQVADP